MAKQAMVKIGDYGCRGRTGGLNYSFDTLTDKEVVLVKGER